MEIPKEELIDCEYCGGDGIYITNDSERIKCPWCEKGKVPKEEPTEEAKQRAANYMSLKGALEPKQIKCYCGHTDYCDCGPLEELKQETPKTFKELFANTGIKPTTDANGIVNYNFKATSKEPKYQLVGECKGNEGNGCFMDSCGHNCGCFVKSLINYSERMYSEEDLIETFKAGGKMSWTDINQETQEPYYYDFKEWFKQFKKK